MRITKPQTQRRRLFQAPAHIRHKHFSAPLSPELKKKHGTNAIPVKAGDTVRIMRGDRKGFEGKVSRVDRAKYRIFIDGVTRTKVDGTSIQVPVHPSKAMITNLDLDDKWRKKVLERKGMMPSKKEAPPPPEAVVAEKEVKAEEAEKKPKAREEARKPRRKKKEEPEPTQEKEKKAGKTAKAEAKPRRRKKKKAEVKKGEE
jgi:large subunit ribosomal protein L24